MKKLLTLLLLINYLASFSQTQTGKPNPGTTKTGPGLGTDKKKYRSSTTAALDQLHHGECLDKQFSIVFYVVLDSAYVPGGPITPANGFATQGNIDKLVADLNKSFKPICVSFVSCSTVYIPNFSYGKTWVQKYTEPGVKASYYTDKTINFYLVDSLFQEPGADDRDGYTYLPTAANLNTAKRDVIVLEKIRLLQQASAPACHLFGRYFGLPHTFDEINPSPPATPGPPAGVDSHEFSDGSNCYQHGDGFCDTEADPGDILIYKDGKGMFYVHPIDNYMSYYNIRTRFTQEQLNSMAQTILTKRMYLH